jgi:hypothetical protein
MFHPLSILLLLMFAVSAAEPVAASRVSRPRTTPSAR